MLSNILVYDLLCLPITNELSFILSTHQKYKLRDVSNGRVLAYTSYTLCDISVNCKSSKFLLGTQFFKSIRRKRVHLQILD